MNFEKGCSTSARVGTAVALAFESFLTLAGDLSTADLDVAGGIASKAALNRRLESFVFGGEHVLDNWGVHGMKYGKERRAGLIGIQATYNESEEYFRRE